MDSQRPISPQRVRKKGVMSKGTHSKNCKITARDHHIRVQGIRFPPRGSEKRVMWKGTKSKNRKLDFGTTIIEQSPPQNNKSKSHPHKNHQNQKKKKLIQKQKKEKRKTKSWCAPRNILTIPSENQGGDRGNLFSVVK